METFITDINRSANRGSRIETWKPGYKPTSEETEIMTTHQHRDITYLYIFKKTNKEEPQ